MATLANKVEEKLRSTITLDGKAASPAPSPPSKSSSKPNAKPVNKCSFLHQNIVDEQLQKQLLRQNKILSIKPKNKFNLITACRWILRLFQSAYSSAHRLLKYDILTLMKSLEHWNFTSKHKLVGCRLILVKAFLTVGIT